jgi:hypothetical protein
MFIDVSKEHVAAIFKVEEDSGSTFLLNFGGLLKIPGLSSQRTIFFKKIRITQLLGFWILSIVRYSRNEKTQRFGNCICFRPQVRSEYTYSVGSLRKS